MKPIGNYIAVLVLLACAFGTASTVAAVTASVDRDRVALGDTVRLTITADGNEETSNTDLRPLLADFEVLQRSTSSNTSIVNGRRTHTRQILIDITPRREGTLKIPPMRVGNTTTNMLLLAVAPAPASQGGNQNVVFQAELDADKVYVQGQVILTLRVQQAINLDNRSITELQLDNAFVKPLEQQSFQRTIDGRPWLVHELRYAIFPEQSGTLEIPAQTFSARESSPRRSFFDSNSGGRQLRRSTEALQIDVLPRPTEFPGNAWLPARSITLEESWSTPPEQLRAGESATRTILVKGEGLQGAQLPPILLPPTDGLKFYPDQPVISEAEIGSGLLGSRKDSAAVVPTRAGAWTIPEVRIPWWDTQAGKLRYAVLPQRTLDVAAADPQGITRPLVLPQSASEQPSITIQGDTSLRTDAGPWRIIAAISSLGWILTLLALLWLWLKRRPDTQSPQDTTENLGEKQAFKQLLAACAGDSPDGARRWLVAWGNALFSEQNVVSAKQLNGLFRDAEIDALLVQLDAALYAKGEQQWRGSELADTVRRLRKQHTSSTRKPDQQLRLYPA